MGQGKAGVGFTRGVRECLYVHGGEERRNSGIVTPAPELTLAPVTAPWEAAVITSFNGAVAQLPGCGGKAGGKHMWAVSVCVHGSCSLSAEPFTAHVPAAQAHLPHRAHAAMGAHIRPGKLV